MNNKVQFFSWKIIITFGVRAIAFLRCLILLWILDRVTQLYTQAQGTHFSLLYDTHELHLDYHYAPVAKRSFLKNALPNKDFVPYIFPPTYHTWGADIGNYIGILQIDVLLSLDS
jgi:hypothetical protein